MKFYVKRKTSSEKTIEHNDDELQHFGILGMKWGVRRYQNPDGTLTKAGKRHARKIAAKEAYKKYSDAYDQYLKAEKERRKKEKEEKKAGLPEGYFYKKDASSEVKKADEQIEQLADQLLKFEDNDTRRGEEAAKTGLMALLKTGMRGNDLDPNNEYDREWFLLEDQTIGLGVIADMANKGWSKDKIMKTISDAETLYEKSGYYYNYGKQKQTGYTKDLHGVMELRNGYSDEYGQFAEACVEVAKERQKK